MSADARLVPGEPGLYERLGVNADADAGELRGAYRRLARLLHPDLHRSPTEDTQLQMALLNEAWAVLSDPTRRRDYDQRCRERDRAAAAASAAANRTASGPAPFLRAEERQAPRFIVTRKGAWLDGMAMRIRFLAGYAGRSAVQAMLLRHPGTARTTWEAIVPQLCQRLSVDVGERIKAARAAGAAPLDLANAAALLGLSAYGEELLAGAAGLAPEELARHAEMVDRVYETLAYELPRELVQQLGNAPKVLRRLTRRR